MSRTTWNEFKRAVEEFLSANGLDGTIPIYYIDLRDDDNTFTVYNDDEEGMYIL